MKTHTIAGLTSQQQGRIEEARTLYRQALEQDEADLDALYLLAVLEYQHGRREDASNLARQLHALKPNTAAMYELIGVVEQDLANVSAAQAAYETGLEIDPQHKNTRYRLASLFQQQAKFDHALVHLHHLLEADRNDRDALLSCGNIYSRQGQHGKAEAVLQQILHLNPADLDARFNLGNIYKEIAKFDAAERCYRACLELNPSHRPSQNNLGEILRARGQLDKAIAQYEAILRSHGQTQEAVNNLAVVLKETDQTDRAALLLEEFLEAQPEFASLWNNLGNIYKDQGRIEEAMTCFNKAIALDTKIPEIYSNRLLTMQYLPKLKQEQLYHAHLEQAQRVSKGLKALYDHGQAVLGTKARLKIGYVSADFRDHAVARFIEAVIEKHNRKQFQIYCYYNHPIEDAVTLRIKSQADHWLSCYHISDVALAKQIRDDQIDILVDLSGHSASGRLGVFALKPAPIQVTYLGYIATTGLSAIDYRFTHIDADPRGNEAYYSERLYRLDGRLWWAYRPSDDAPPVSELPTNKNGFVTFGSTNNFAKINAEVIATWAQILIKCQQSQILFVGVPAGKTQEQLRNAFQSHGVSPDRIKIKPKLNVKEYLAVHQEIDICLDPWPYNGGTTTCDALWMGVPVISLIGEAFASRMGFALLQNVGLADCVGATLEEYIEAAVRLSQNLPELGKLRSGMREMLNQSPLRDEQGFTEKLEHAYHAMWRNLVEQSKPGSNQLNLLNPPNLDTKKMKTFLHVGCGPSRKQHTTPGFNTDEWKELRFDIDQSVQPDIVGTMLDMSAVPSASVDAIYSSHNIEHLYPHEVALAMKEFKRVLKDDGYLIITCPDLQAVCQLVAEDKLTDVAYNSPLGPISPIDILFGLRSSMEKGNLYMAHRCGFTLSVLLATLRDCGFQSYAGIRRPASFELWAVGTMKAVTEEELQTIAKLHFLR